MDYRRGSSARARGFGSALEDAAPSDDGAADPADNSLSNSGAVYIYDLPEHPRP